jgi:flagellar protein FliL
MANKKPAAAEAAPAPAAGGGKKRLIIMIVLGLLLVGISVGGTIAALKFMGPKKDAAKEEKAEEHKEESSEAKTTDEHGKPLPALYLELKPEIVVSFDVAGRQRFLKATVNMVTRDPDVQAAVTLHSPIVANAMVMLISGKAFEELQSAEGKENLRKQSLEEINKIVEKETKKKNGIEQVLFSEFVMQ